VSRQLLVITFLTFCSTLGAGPVCAETPRVRALDGTIDALLVSGSAKSITFRTLLERLERSDVIVHVEPWPLQHGRRRVGGMLRFVTRAGGFRYVRISLSVHLPRDTAVALLGHELQHALEVADDASVVDDITFEALYHRIGDTCLDAAVVRTYDTSGARSAERRIREELREFSRHLLARR